MVGSSHTRRLATIVLAAVFIFTASGCYFRQSEVGPDQGGLWCPGGIDLGPGHVSSGPGDSEFYWLPDPTSATIQFAVVSSDSTEPITAVAAGSPGGSFGVVWDGTRSSGTQSIPWDGSTDRFVLVASTSGTVHIDWWIMALDSAGSEVGFTCGQLFGGGFW